MPLKSQSVMQQTPSLDPHYFSMFQVVQVNSMEHYDLF